MKFFHKFSFSSCLAGFLIGAFVTGSVATTSALLSASTRFPDVTQGAFYDEDAAWGYNSGIIGGYENGNFGPDDPVTRGQMVVMLRRFEKYMKGEFTGVRVSRPITDPNATASSSSSVAQTSTTSSSSSTSTSTSTSSSSVSTSGATPATRDGAGTIAFSINEFSVSEGSASAKISVFRTGGTDGRVTVTFSTEDDTAESGKDYHGNTNNTITFQDGETNNMIEINLIDDDITDGNEKFRIVLHSVSNGGGLGEKNKATISIIDNEDPATASTVSESETASGGMVSFSAEQYAFPENAGSVTITVVRDGETDEEATVEYATSDGTAESGTHYDSTSGTITFSSGQTEKTFTINLQSNDNIEGNKKLNLTLKNLGDGVAFGKVKTAELIIVDDDMSTFSYDEGTFSFVDTEYTGSESTGEAYVKITRIGGSEGQVTVNYETNPLSASEGTDYEDASGTLTFKDGESEKWVRIKIIEDDVSDSSEQFKVKLSNATDGAKLGSDLNATVTIEEN